MHLAQILLSHEHRDQGTGAAGKPPGSNSDAKGQVIQRRKQQIPHALVAHLTQDEEYDELFIITGCCMGCSVTIWLSSSYIPHMPVYSLLHMSRTHNIIYFMFGLLFCCFVFWLFFFYFIIICTQNT